MISFDTNILFRVFLDDDILQAEQARALLKHATHSEKAYISSYVVIELVWVLKSNKFPKQKIIEVLHILLTSANLVIGNVDLIVDAISLFEKGSADFSDYIILLDSDRNGAKKLETFDGNLREAAYSFYGN